MGKGKLHEGRPIIFNGQIKSDSIDILNHVIDMALLYGENITHFIYDNNVIKFFNSDYYNEGKAPIELPLPLNNDNAHKIIYNVMLNTKNVPNESSTDGSNGSNGFGFIAEFGEFGEPILTIKVINLYYSKLIKK